MLKATGLVKSYGEKIVLKQVDLEVRSGECLGILGPNGSGKSTLVKLLVGEEEPDQGEVRLEGQKLGSYSRKERAKKIAVLAQESLSEVSFSAEEIVRMGRYPYQNMWQWKDEAGTEVVRRVMKQTGIWEGRERQVNQLSGGERQRVAIAKAMAQETQLLVLDEPTTYLDIHYQLTILNLLKEYQEKHQLTMILVLHDLNLAAQYCDRLLLLKKGRVMKVGTVDEVFCPEYIEEVYGVRPIIVSHPERHVPQILLTADRNGERR